MKKLWLAIALAALGLTSACGSGAAGTGGDTITIGLISPFSGPAASFGPPEEASLKYAVQQINADGGVEVDGKQYKFKVKSYDSAYDPTKAVTVSRQALTQDGVKFLEVLGGGVAGAVQPVAEGSGALMFVMGAGSNFTGSGHPLTFQPYYNIPQSLEACLQALKEADSNLGNGLLSIYTDDDLGAALMPDSKKRAVALGFDVTDKLVARDVTDFASVLTGIANKVDLIDFGSLPPSQYAVAAKQARQLGFKGRFIFPSTVNLTELVKVTGAGAVEGGVAAPSWDTSASEVGKGWTDYVREKTGTVQPWTAQNFDNMLLLKAAIEKAGSIDTAKVAKALKTVTADGVLGSVSYGDDAVFDLKYPVSQLNAKGELEPLK